MISEEEITILVPIMRPPDVTSVDVKAIKKIIDKLEEKIIIKQVWVIFQNSKFKIQNSKNRQVIHFEDFKNAVEIIEKFQPKFILFDGELTILSLAFALAGKKKEIPTVGTFFIPEIKKAESRWIKNRIRMIFSKTAFTDTVIESELDESKAIKFLIREYSFLLKTIKKINLNLFELVKFFITYPRVQLFSKYHIAHHKINEADLTLCSTYDWKVKLEESGFNNENLKVIGTPVYDDLFNKTKEMNFKHKNNEKIKILFCTASMHEHGIWSKEVEDQLIKNTINKLNEFENFQVSLKIHPITSSIKEYEKLLNEVKFETKLYQKEDFLKLIKEYAIIIAYGPSSIVHECVLLGKPIILLQLIKEDLTELMYDENIIETCKDLNRISDIINNIQNKKEQNILNHKYIKNTVGRFDGKCSERAINEILNIIKIN